MAQIGLQSFSGCDGMEKRIKRYLVYSQTHDGNPLLIESFDLPQQAQLLADQLNSLYCDMLREHRRMQKPRITVVDAREEGMQCSGL